MEASKTWFSVSQTEHDIACELGMQAKVSVVTNFSYGKQDDDEPGVHYSVYCSSEEIYALREIARDCE